MVQIQQAIDYHYFPVPLSSFLSVEHLSEIGSYCEKTASVIFDAIIETALQYAGLSKNDGVTVLA